MVFKPLNLARQNFVKTFTHGYAQSLVAASQSSSASQNTSFHTLGSNVATLLGKPGAQNQAQTHNAVQHPTSASGANVKAFQPDGSNNDGGLAAYYAAWQKHRKSEDKELHQFQFAKRIGWKAPTTIPEGPLKSKDAAKRPATSSGTRRATLTRSNTTSALDQLKQSAEKEPLEPSENTQHNEFLVRDAPSLTPPQQATVAEDDISRAASQAATPTHAVVSTPSALSEISRSPAKSTEASSVSAAESYTEHLTTLAERQQYAEVPAVFESMLASGVVPTASAYNALLLAAISLPRGKHQVASKVLDVYADMLRRCVAPDTSTYAILIELLAARAMDVIAMKQELAEKYQRYAGSHGANGFLLRSDETEAQILAEDDALSVAVQLFDTSAAVATDHVFSAETYRLLISACAETGRIGDMVRIYAGLESQGVVAPSAVFPPMITAFANAGDLRSAVECYDVYKDLAVANNDGKNAIIRKDDEVYAAVMQAYATCGRLDGGLQFAQRIEETFSDESGLVALRDTIYPRGVYRQWLQQGRHDEVIAHASAKLTSLAKIRALCMVCIDASIKDIPEVATKAFNVAVALGKTSDLPEAAGSLIAMHVRHNDARMAMQVWSYLRSQEARVSLIEPTVAFASLLLKEGRAEEALSEACLMFGAMRRHVDLVDSQMNVNERIDEALETLAIIAIETSSLSASAAVQFLRGMADNGRAITSVTEHILAVIGPEQVAALSPEDVKILAQIEASFLSSPVAYDIAHGARFAHLLDIAMTSGTTFDPASLKMVEEALSRLGRPDLSSRWHSLQSPQIAVLHSRQFPPSPPYTASSIGYEDNYDPYASSTDFKGSSFIADELEKTYGSHAQHLQEALFRFRNMRRIGRHPRYMTYAKLIGAAAKENQLDTAEDVLAMAKQDVPYVAQSSVVRNGWSAILDSMISACLTVGKRDHAARYHQDLIKMGAAPSANTFGLYITTLKESTKTFDEATEAVKIFHQAKAEGVEPSSFLYNALIGKLGKARRIDDCLFYFAEMRALGIRPTSVTYGTVVNALCRVSDDKFAEQLFEEMESCANYKPRPAPYNSLMQYFLTTKRDRSKVLSYYERMQQNRITPTMHTYKLLIDTYATLAPVDLDAAERVIQEIRTKGLRAEPVHYAALIHAKGCVLHDMAGARALFDSVMAEARVKPQACLYQALFESYVANHDVASTESLLPRMKQQGVPMTAYIANTLIHGWATAKNIQKARDIYEKLGREGREPSTYEAMTRANLAVEEQGEAKKIVGEALRRGYPAAVAGKICDLVAPPGAAHA